MKPRLTYSYDEFLKQLGAKLRSMRLERGWSLRDMIVHHGYHLVQWQNLEKGKGLSVPSLLRLCQVFDVRLTELIEGLAENSSSSPQMEERPVRSSVSKATVKSVARKVTRSRLTG